MIKDIAQFFLIGLAFGTGLFSFIADAKLTGSGLVKVVQSVVAGALLISFGIFVSQHGLDLSRLEARLFVTLMAVVALETMTLGDGKRSALNWGLYLLQNLLFAWLAHALLALMPKVAGAAYLFFLSSILFVGITHYAMVLGHWYLVTPKLSERPLLNCMKIFFAVLAAKVVTAMVALIQNRQFFSSVLGLGEAGEYHTNGIGSFDLLVVAMRLLWGFVILGVLGYYTWRLVKMRSIQSATGILYVMVFFIFIGEMISGYLFLQYGLFL